MVASVLRPCDASATTGPLTLASVTSRYWRAVELWRAPRVWPQFEAMLLWADDEADLMDPRSWTATAPLPFDVRWTPQWAPPLKWQPGFLEGNPVVDPRSGQVVVVLRAQVRLQAVLSLRRVLSSTVSGVRDGCDGCGWA
jgi:hypothetical protein